MKNKMGSKFIRVRVEHPQRKKEDIELVQDVKVKPVLEQKEKPVKVWIDDLGGKNGTITSGQ